MITLGLKLDRNPNISDGGSAVAVVDRKFIDDEYADESIFSCQHIAIVVLKPGNFNRNISTIFLSKLKDYSSADSTISLNLMIKALVEVCALMYRVKATQVKTNDAKKKIRKLTNLGRERNEAFSDFCRVLSDNFTSMLVSGNEYNLRILSNLRQQLAGLTSSEIF